MGGCIEVQLLDKLHSFLNEFETEGRQDIWSRHAFRFAYDTDPSVEWTDKKCTMRAIRFVRILAIFCHNADLSGLDEDVAYLYAISRTYFEWLKGDVPEVVESGDVAEPLAHCLWVISTLRVQAAKMYGKLVEPPLGVVLDEFCLSAQLYVMDVPPKPIGWGRTPHDYATVESYYSLTVKHLECFTYLLSKTTSDNKKKLQPSVGALILSILRLAHASDVRHTNTAQEEESILRSSSDMSLQLSTQYIRDTPMMFITVEELLRNLFSHIDLVVFTNIVHKINLINLEYFRAIQSDRDGEALSLWNQFFQQPLEYLKNQEIFIHRLIEYFLREIAGSLCDPSQVSEDMILQSSLQILETFKAAAFYMMLGHNASNYESSDADRSINTPYKKSFISFREFLSGTPQSSPATEAEPNQLFSKDDLKFEDVTAFYEQGCSSSFDDFIQRGRVVFVDHLLENMRKNLNNQPRVFNIFKDQIGTLLQELELVGSFLTDFMEKDIWLQVIRIIHEAEYVLDMFLLGDAPPWFQQLLISNAIKEIRQFKAQIHYESSGFDDQAKINVDMLHNRFEQCHNFWNEFHDEGAEEYWRNYVYRSYILNSSAHLSDKNSTMRAISFLKIIQYAYGAEWSCEDKNFVVVCERRNNYHRWLNREILECDDPHQRASEIFTTIGLVRIKFGDTCDQLVKVPHPALFLDGMVFDQIIESIQQYVMSVPKAPLGWGHSSREYGLVEANFQHTVGMLDVFRHLVCTISKSLVDQNKLQYFLTRAATLVFSIMHMARKNDVLETHSEEMEESMLSSSFKMSRELSPQNQDAMKVYLDVLLAKVDIIKDLKQSAGPLHSMGSNSFLSLLQSAQNHAHILGEILEFTMMDLIDDEQDDYNENVEILLKQGYLSVAKEAASLFSSSPLNHGVLSNLLHKLNLIKREVFLLEVHNLKATSTSFGDKQAGTVKEAFRSLTQFFKMTVVHMGNEEKTIIRLIHSFLEETGSLCEFSDDEILQSSLVILKLFKTEALFMLLSSFKIRTATFHKILLFIRDLVSSTPNGDMDPTVSNTCGNLICKEVSGFSFEDSHEDSPRNMKLNFEEIEKVYIQDLWALFNNFPRSHGSCFEEHLLGKLKFFANNLPDSIFSMKDQFEIWLSSLDFFVSFLKDSKNKGLELRVTFFIYAAEYIIERFIHGEGPLRYHHLVLYIAIQEAEFLKAQILKHCHDEESLELSFQVVQPTLRHETSGYKNLPAEGFIAGLDDQAKVIVAKLQNPSKHLQVVSLVGMAGIGKTTLARNVYSSPPIRRHFAVCAMCSVSQVYRKRELLLDILGDFVEVTDDMKKKDDNDLALIVKRKLKGRRYLVVIDDIWKIEHWNDLRLSFPDDNLGSRILFTTRSHDVALLADPKMEPNIVPLLSPKQSWDLLQAKVFDGESCPEQLMRVGSLIAKNCKGLPLAIVVVGGILKRTEKKKDQWEAIAEHLRSLIADDEERHFSDILEFSYNQLPSYLKPCFLYLGSFLEDQEIPVKKLQWLWMGEGFIPTVDSKSLKETAEGYLKELMNRSLVMEAKRSSLGGTKSCRIHDMLRDLCIRKSKEEKFMQLITMDDMNNSDSSVGTQYRLCVHSPKQAFIQLRPSTSNVHSLLFFATSNNQEKSSYDISPIFKSFKLLRILDLEPVTASIFPSGTDLLVCLKYLAIKGNMKSVPSSISKLSNLETLVVKGTRGEIALPSSLWSMSTLQHVHVRPRASLALCSPELDSSLVLQNLVSFSSPAILDWKEAKKILRMCIGVKSLRCIFETLSHWDTYHGRFVFHSMEFLTQLESLSVSYIGKTFPCRLGFPRNIKKLTLSRFCFSWDYMSVIIQLSKLEVLKLLIKAFEGDTWDMKEECIFPKLKYLKLENLSIANWFMNSLDCKEHFPELQILVLRGCKQLVAVPSSFGDVPTLQMIEMRLCRQSAIESTQTILEQQKDLGNPDFKIKTTY